MWFYYLLGALGVLAVISLLTALICFFKVFYSPTRRPLGENEYEIPKGEIYDISANLMREKGYVTRVLDFVNPDNSDVHYNPLH